MLTEWELYYLNTTLYKMNLLQQMQKYLNLCQSRPVMYLRNDCRVCGSHDLLLFLDLGLMPDAEVKTKNQLKSDRSYPLKLYYCRNCHLVQVINILPAEELFTNYVYRSSVAKTLVEHFEKYAKELSERYVKQGEFIVEFGCNDGVLLGPLKKYGVDAIGIDPAKTLKSIAEEKGLSVITDYFTQKIAMAIVKNKGKAKVITGSNVFAHIDNLDETMRAINILLDDNGIFVVEVHYLVDIFEKLQYDAMYHEHLCNYSLLPLNYLMSKHDMEIFDVKRIPIHAGSIRVYVKKKSNKVYKIQSTVSEAINFEIKMGLNNIEAYLDFARRVEKSRENLRKVLLNLKDQGSKIVGYGAGGRTHILICYCNIDTNILDYIVDDSPERYNKFTSGIHIPIYHPSRMEKFPPDYILLFAWNYREEILRKEHDFLLGGGRFIIPLPEVEIIKS